MAGTITFFIMYYGVLALISAFFVKNTEASELKSKMIDPIVTNKFDYKEILVNDFMYPAWDITNKKPVFFSTSIADEEIKEDSNSLYKMNFN